MNRTYRKIYDDIIFRLTHKNSPDISNVKKAFLFAEKMHSGQFRKSGEPYILHPICVAEILEKLNFDTDVISAAILHDVMEDCGVTFEQIAKDFNKQIAEIVDGVTAITNDEYLPDFENLFSNPEEFLKLAIEDKTYQKLISIGKNNKFAFYIKFADRLHNLGTISVFSRHKKLAKVEETEKWIIPIAKLLKSRFFVQSLQNLCFRIRHEEEPHHFFENYDRYKQNNKKIQQNLTMELSEKLEEYISIKKSEAILVDIIFENKTDYEVYKSIQKKFDVSSLARTKQSNFNFVSTSTIFFIINFNQDLKKLNAFLLDFLTHSMKGKLTISGIETDRFNNTFINFCDSYHNIYSCIAVSPTLYTEITNGTTDGTDIDDIDETNTGKIVTSFINIYTRSGQLVRMPKNSTVLDFAFKIHNDLGFSCKYAIINNSPTKSPIHTKLNEGDKIEVFNETTENGLTKNIAELRWLMYVENESSKKALIKYFEKKYKAKK